MTFGHRFAIEFEINMGEYDLSIEQDKMLAFYSQISSLTCHVTPTSRLLSLSLSDGVKPINIVLFNSTYYP